MSVSKRLRYEILRRDNHACRYCGATAPDAPLTVDHVVPVALGGTDEPNNLVTACKDCNSGKSSSSPDAPVVDDVKLKSLIWANAMQHAADERAAEFAQQRTQMLKFEKYWQSWHWTDRQGVAHTIPLPGTWRTSVIQFISAGLTLDDLFGLVDVAMSANTTDEWRYFCGCCWRRVRQAQERAAEIASRWEEEARGQ